MSVFIKNTNVNTILYVLDAILFMITKVAGINFCNELNNGRVCASK